MQQQALMQHLRRQLGREPLGAGREPSVRLAAILEPQRFVAKETRCTKSDRCLGERKRDALEA